MTEEAIWMVRAGQGAAFVDDFIDNSFVGIGFRQAAEVTSPVQKEAVIAAKPKRDRRCKEDGNSCQ